MKKKWEILIGILVIAAIVIILLLNRFEETGQVINTGNSLSGTTNPVTYANIESYLSSNQVVKALPSSAAITLKFYNWDKGYREWEKSYILTKGSAAEGVAEDPDMTIIVASRYISQISSLGLCGVISQAKANGDLGTRTERSNLALMWKFKGMFSYRECLGF